LFRLEPKSAWSKSNLDRAERLITEGRMTPAGFRAYHAGDRREVQPLPTVLPKALENKFRRQRVAWANYQKFPPGYRRMTSGWVASAKKEKTRIKRLEKLIEYSAHNERIEFISIFRYTPSKGVKLNDHLQDRARVLRRCRVCPAAVDRPAHARHSATARW
jgi:hypothetical protein